MRARLAVVVVVLLVVVVAADAELVPGPTTTAPVRAPRSMTRAKGR
jgi:hypothetical protein